VLPSTRVLHFIGSLSGPNESKHKVRVLRCSNVKHAALDKGAALYRYRHRLAHLWGWSEGGQSCAQAHQTCRAQAHWGWSEPCTSTSDMNGTGRQPCQNTVCTSTSDLNSTGRQACQNTVYTEHTMSMYNPGQLPLSASTAVLFSLFSSRTLSGT
jgi:hypothetical protein